MKRIQAMVLAAALMAMPMAGFAAEKSAVVLGEISANSGLVKIEVENNAERETGITLKVVKLQPEYTDEQNTYEVLQAKLPPHGTEEFILAIPDFRNGISGTGEYLVSLQTGDGTILKDSFTFAASGEITSFIEDLKAANEMVEQQSQAHLYLMPVLIPDEEPEKNAGVFFAIGLDFDYYKNQSAEVKQEALNQLYSAGIADIDGVTFAEKFACALALAVYNVGDKTEALSMLSKQYGGSAVNESLFDETLSHMASGYTSIESMEQAFKIAYGLEAINTSQVAKMEENLKNFRDETDLCTTEINNILNLSTKLKYNAYEAILASVQKSKLSDENQLESLLVTAYNTAKDDGMNRGSGGSGGAGGGGGGMTSVTPRHVGGNNGTGQAEIQQQVFPDLPLGHWAEESVKWAKVNGVLSGNEKGYLEPERSVNREEFTKMLIAAMGCELLEEKLPFEDVEPGSWYAPYIASALQNGIVNGMSDTIFGVEQTISRQDMAVMIYRAWTQSEMQADAVRAYNEFADEQQIADYAKDAITALYQAGILNGKGDNLMDPTGNATRAEAAKMIYEAFGGKE